VTASVDIERIVRDRLRALRRTAGWSLDELAVRAGLSASTISRLETGKRTLGLDVLLPLARAFRVDLNALLDTAQDDDVVIRPLPTPWADATMWPLTRPGRANTAIKLRLEPTTRAPEPQVHPGHDWLFVLEGRVQLTLGDRQIVVEAGEAAEFSTMTPHAVSALAEPAELIMVFDQAGDHAHLHHDR
jgi:transcriptional regulator with XRE-family HTH domain